MGKDTKQKPVKLSKSYKKTEDNAEKLKKYMQRKINKDANPTR